MHPVLSAAIEPLASISSKATLEEAQVPPLPGQGRWCAQQILEHLILSYETTSSVIQKQLLSGKVPRNRRTMLEFLIRVQTLGFGYMPGGIPATRAVRPGNYLPEPGHVTAARLIAAAEAMDSLLVQARKKFGIQACGEHPFFGVMRVDEWRRYHAIHARHHQSQLETAIRFARTQQQVPVAV